MMLKLHRTRREAMLIGAGLAAASCAAAAPATRRVRPGLYNCEGCEGLAERDPAKLGPSAQMAGPAEAGDRLVVTGIVRSAETGEPVPGVIIYAYQTDAAGLYSRGTPETEWSRRHGLLRGWVKTGTDGRYTFRTIKPAPYPNQTMPAHVHLTVGEPAKQPYYIDDVVFEDEAFVDARYRAAQELRGGSGITLLSRRPDGTWLARRDIVLERHPGS